MLRATAEGRLNGIQPEIGTLVPGRRWGGYAVVVAVDDTGCTLKPATRADLEAAGRVEYPRSIAELPLQRIRQAHGRI